VDYRRVTRNYANDYPNAYLYMDRAKEWKYSISDPSIKGSFFTLGLSRGVGTGVALMGETNFGTCLAVHFFGSHGGLTLLPPLGVRSDEEINAVLDDFLNIELEVPPPQWAREVFLPGQSEIQERIASNNTTRLTIERAIVTAENELAALQRWKRLLYDDGFGLEAIVREAFELLGASIAKTSQEKDDYRVRVAAYPEGVMEVKGTKKPEFSRKDLRQLSDWMDQATEDEKIVPKGMFVGNAGREGEPKSRGRLFDANNEALAKREKIVVLRSVDLYGFVILRICGQLEVNAFWKEIFECDGSFDATKYWELVPEEFRL
jgi:hypothetical protein